MVIRWLLELSLFGEREEALAQAARARGHEVSVWRDAWWDNDRFPCRPGEQVVFHGSLENAARLAADPRFVPGAFCASAAFRCSAYYPQAQDYLLFPRPVFSTVRALVSGPQEYFPQVPRLFVRPDSPLKPFAGRVLARERITPADLDHGYYYDDLDLAVVVCPAVPLQQEWRLVIAGGAPVAGSGYDPAGRRPLAPLAHGPVWDFAAGVAAVLPAPEAVYVMDVCATEAGLRLLELNPFSGADLYACPAAPVVLGVERVLLGPRSPAGPP